MGGMFKFRKEIAKWWRKRKSKSDEEGNEISDKEKEAFSGKAEAQTPPLFMIPKGSIMNLGAQVKIRLFMVQEIHLDLYQKNRVSLVTVHHQLPIQIQGVFLDLHRMNQASPVTVHHLQGFFLDLSRMNQVFPVTVHQLLPKATLTMEQEDRARLPQAELPLHSLLHQIETMTKIQGDILGLLQSIVVEEALPKVLGKVTDLTDRIISFMCFVIKFCFIKWGGNTFKWINRLRC